MFFQAGDFLLQDGKPPDRRGGAQLRGTSPVFRMYRADDGWLFVDARTSPAYAALHRLLAPGESPVPLETVRALRANEGPAPAYAAALTSDSRATWLAKLRAAGVATVPVLSPYDLLDDEHFRANGLVDERDHPEMGRARQAGPLICPSLMPAAVQRRAPLLGEHTREVLAEFGLSEAEVEALFESGAAWGL